MRSDEGEDKQGEWRATFPPSGQLVLPMLEAIKAEGGQAAPHRVYEALADRLELPDGLRNAKQRCGMAGVINLWHRAVRNARQHACSRGMIESDPAKTTFNLWQITEKGSRALHNCKPGILITVLETDRGQLLYAECETAAGMIGDGTVDLILTSPPYPLLTKKGYGNREGNAYIDWLVALARAWKTKLRESGSMIINVADTWAAGAPTMDGLYQERLLIRLIEELGLHLAQKFFWYNPAKLPGPAEWVNVRRIRVTPAVEQIFWLSLSERPKADNRRVLRAYSKSMKKRLASGGESAAFRPSGHRLSDGAFSEDRGGSIPHNLISASNTDSNSLYLRRCREAGLPIHPARMPEAIADFFIRFLTDENDLIYEPFSGSGVVPAAAERLGRRWVAAEKSLTYILGSAFRFEGVPSLTTYFDRIAA